VLHTNNQVNFLSYAGSGSGEETNTVKPHPLAGVDPGEESCGMRHMLKDFQIN
jgi:hypothetical protein